MSWSRTAVGGFVGGGIAKLISVIEHLDEVEEALSSVSGGVGGGSPAYLILSSNAGVAIMWSEFVLSEVIYKPLMAVVA